MPILASGQLSHCPAFWTSSPAPMPAGVSSIVLPLALKSTVGGDVPSHDPWARSPTCCWVVGSVGGGRASLPLLCHPTSDKWQCQICAHALQAGLPTTHKTRASAPVLPGKGTGPALQCSWKGVKPVLCSHAFRASSPMMSECGLGPALHITPRWQSRTGTSA